MFCSWFCVVIISTNLDKPFLSVKLLILSYPSVITYVLGAQKNRLIGTVLLSTHNMFWLRKRKLFFFVRTLT